jgi:uncharacterized membrane protein
MSTRMSARMSARVSARMPDQEAIYLFKAARRQRLPHEATDMLACFWQVVRMKRTVLQEQPMSRIRSASLEAVGVGVVSGMRTLLMPALLSRPYPGHRGEPPAHGAADLLRSPTLSNVLVFASASELVGDKLPAAPDRTEMPPLVARALSGGLAAAVLAARNGRAPMPAAVLGAVAAVGTAHAMVRLRRATGRRLNIPDPLVGLAEDCVAFAIGRTLLRPADSRA